MMKLSRAIWFLAALLMAWGGRMVIEGERLERVIDTGHQAGDRLFDELSFWVCVAVTGIGVWWVRREGRAQ